VHVTVIFTPRQTTLNFSYASDVNGFVEVEIFNLTLNMYIVSIVANQRQKQFCNSKSEYNLK
jgi:hypothetical protein